MKWAVRLGFAALFAPLLLWFALSVVGAVWVTNNTDDEVRAVILVGDEEHDMLRLPGGTFFAIPRMDGEVRVTCSDGSSAIGGYVTRHLRTSVTVVGASPCEVVENF